MGSRNNTRRSRKRRVAIKWKDNTGVKPAPFAQNIPRYMGESRLPEDIIDKLTVGTMFVSKCCLTLDSSVIAGRLQYLIRCWHEPSATVKAGSVLIYSGIVRVEERGKRTSDRTVSVPRHTFIVGSDRFIINDLGLIEPA
jgi:hypothetical protein